MKMKKIMVVIVVVIMIMGLALYTEYYWNGGICSKCNVEYTITTTMNKGNEQILFKCPICERFGSINPALAFITKN